MTCHHGIESSINLNASLRLAIDLGKTVEKGKNEIRTGTIGMMESWNDGFTKKKLDVRCSPFIFQSKPVRHIFNL